MSEIGDELGELVTQLAGQVPRQGEGQVPAAWADVVELGLVGIGIPEERGGSGGGVDDLVLVAGELARHGLHTPFVEAATTSLLVAADADAFGTVVVDPVGLRSADGAVSGVVRAPWGAAATSLAVVEAAAVRVVDLAHPSVQRQSQNDIAGLPGARVVLSGTPAEAVEADPDEVRARLALLRSAAVLGAGRGAFDLTRGYVAQRQQFGAPLIRLPAVAATVARMSTELVQAGAAVDRATAMAGDGSGDRPSAHHSAVVARIATSAMATAIARDAHQLHGAMGVTAEYSLHRFTRALWAWRDLDESEIRHARRLGALAAAVGETVLWDELTA